MRIVSIILLIMVFTFGIIEMQRASSISKGSAYKELSNTKKIQLITELKKQWKMNIISLAAIIAMLLITVSTFMGKTNNYENLISIISIILSVGTVIFIVINKKKFDKEAKRILS